VAVNTDSSGEFEFPNMADTSRKQVAAIPQFPVAHRFAPEWELEVLKLGYVRVDDALPVAVKNADSASNTVAQLTDIQLESAALDSASELESEIQRSSKMLLVTLPHQNQRVQNHQLVTVETEALAKEVFPFFRERICSLPHDEQVSATDVSTVLMFTRNESAIMKTLNPELWSLKFDKPSHDAPIEQTLERKKKLEASGTWERTSYPASQVCTAFGEGK
jgi:hypothetical protein